MLNLTLFQPRNFIVVGLIAIFARTLLDGFVRIVDNGGEEKAAANGG